MNKIFAIVFVCVAILKPQIAFTQDITRMHGYVSRGESGYVADSEMDDSAVQTTKIYKIIERTTQGAILEEGDGGSASKQQQYVPIINGALNEFYQSGDAINGNAAHSKLANAVSQQQKPLSGYISFNVGRPMSLTMNVVQDGVTQTLSGQNEIYQGMIGAYKGKLLESLPYMRFEYGVQYEVLSFTEETVDQYNNIRNHNGTATARLFADIPLFPNLAGVIGVEGGVGLFQHFYNEDTSRSLGLSYGILGGATFVLSRETSIYILGRQGAIPKRSISYSDGTSKTASLSSSSIIVGMQFFI